MRNATFRPKQNQKRACLTTGSRPCRSAHRSLGDRLFLQICSCETALGLAGMKKNTIFVKEISNMNHFEKRKKR